MEMVKTKCMESMKNGINEEWTELIDRGGLWHVTETTYQFFHAVEYIVKRDFEKTFKAITTIKI